MDYKQKLINWNNTDKYKKEIDFLNKLLNKAHVSLDYGCGTGYAMAQTLSYGYDVNDYKTESTPMLEYYLNTLPTDIKFADIYMMHSFAHFTNPTTELEKIKSVLSDKGTVTVITPNAEWLDKDYNNDKTVVKHYTQSELCQLFMECGFTVQLVGQFGEYKNSMNERIFLQCTI